MLLYITPRWRSCWKEARASLIIIRPYCWWRTPLCCLAKRNQCGPSWSHDESCQVFTFISCLLYFGGGADCWRPEIKEFLISWWCCTHYIEARKVFQQTTSKKTGRIFLFSKDPAPKIKRGIALLPLALSAPAHLLAPKKSMLPVRRITEFFIGRIRDGTCHRVCLVCHRRRCACIYTAAPKGWIIKWNESAVLLKSWRRGGALSRTRISQLNLQCSSRALTSKYSAWRSSMDDTNLCTYTPASSSKYRLAVIIHSATLCSVPF